MKTFYIAAAAILVSSTALASQPWTLDSCISYALSHNIDIRARSLESRSAELDVTEAKDKFLPQVSAGANQTFNFGRGLTSANTYADRNTSEFGWNVGLSLPLFQGLSAKRQLDYARANLSAMLENIEAAKDDVTLQVMSQYLQVLYCGELLDVAKEQVRISTVELERQQVLFEAGKIPELDLTQARSQLAQDQLTEVTSANDRRIALVDLAHLLQITDLTDFEIAPLSDEQTLLPDAATIYANALGINHAIKASELNIATADRQISLAKTGYIPRLSLNAGLSSAYYKISGIENPSFARQMRDNFNKSIGFTLSIPIFDAFSTRNAVRKAQVQRLNAELQYENATTTLNKAIQQAYYQAEAASAKLSAGITAREAAREAMDAMQEKYNFGRANATEFEQAKTTYIKASAEAVQAKYEALLRMRILQFYNSGR
jgi:outer membrane protein